MKNNLQNNASLTLLGIIAVCAVYLVGDRIAENTRRKHHEGMKAAAEAACNAQAHQLIE